MTKPRPRQLWELTACRGNVRFVTFAAAEAVVRHAFSLGLVRVHACHLTRNPASGRVLQKLGMRPMYRPLLEPEGRAGDQFSTGATGSILNRP